MRDRFVNPANGEEYIWQVSHETEEGTEMRLQVNAVGTTGGGKVYHQGPTEPFTLRWQGKYDFRAQHVAMLQWAQLAKGQTIYLYDYDGQGYEGQITSFAPKRNRKLSFTGRDAGVPHHFWSYELEFLVYSFIGGDMAAAGVTP